MFYSQNVFELKIFFYIYVFLPLLKITTPEKLLIFNMFDIFYSLDKSTIIIFQNIIT